MRQRFPRHTVEIRLEERTLLHQLSLSLVEMAVLTGVLMRLYRAVLLPHIGTGFLPLVSFYVVGLLLVLGLVTSHLSNYPLHQWSWRVPVFILVEVATEVAMSAGLILLGREPLGTSRAVLHDWPRLATMTLGYRALTVAAWALLLAAMVVVVRRSGMAREEGADLLP